MLKLRQRAFRGLLTKMTEGKPKPPKNHSESSKSSASVGRVLRYIV